MLGDNDENTPVTFGDIPTIARAILEKTNRESPTDFIQFGTLVAVVATSTGTVPYCQVSMDGDPPGQVVTVASLMGSALTIGMRVAVIFDKPHGAYIIGTPSAGQTALARGSFAVYNQDNTSAGCSGQGVPGSGTGLQGTKLTVQWCCAELESGGATVETSYLQAGPAGVYAYNIEIPYSYEYPYYAAGVNAVDSTVVCNGAAPTELLWDAELNIFDFADFSHDFNTGKLYHRGYGYFEMSAEIQFTATNVADSIYVWFEVRDGAGAFSAVVDAESVVTFNSAGFGWASFSGAHWMQPGYSLSVWAMDATGAPLGVVTPTAVDAHQDSLKSHFRMWRRDFPELYFSSTVYSSSGALVHQCAWSQQWALIGTVVLSGIVLMNSGDRFVVRAQHDAAGTYGLGTPIFSGSGFSSTGAQGASGSIHWVSPPTSWTLCLLSGS